MNYDKYVPLSLIVLILLLFNSAILRPYNEASAQVLPAIQAGISIAQAAIPLVQEILDLIKSHHTQPGSLANRTDSLVVQGLGLYKLGMAKEALGYLNKTLEMNPNDVNAITAKGDILFGLGNADAALRYYDRALHVDPENLPALTSEGSSLARLGLYGKALLYFNKALAISPESRSALNGIGNIFVDDMYYDRGLSYYNKALTVSPNDPITLSNEDHLTVFSH